VRIPLLFEHAKNLGIIVEKKSVSDEEMISHLQSDSRNCIILLISSSLLEPSGWVNRMKTKLIGHSYEGHYILLIGVDNEQIVYINPCDGKTHKIGVDQLFNARTIDGTDEDFIFIFNEMD